MSPSRELRLFLCAVQFLTRIPTPRLDGFESDWITRAARYFPLVGLLVGSLCAAVFWSAAQVWTGAVAALLALGAGVLATGALHEDGLADTADGLAGGQTPARRLSIMKDSRVGTYGVLTLVLVLGLKAAALSDLPPAIGAWALVAAHAAGRGATVLAMAALPYVGVSAKWKPAPTRPGLAEILVALAVAGLPLALSPDGLVLAGLGLGTGLAVALALTARRLIGGYTGDVLGGIEQVFELGFLLGVAAAASRPAGL